LSDFEPPSAAALARLLTRASAQARARMAGGAPHQTPCWLLCSPIDGPLLPALLLAMREPECGVEDCVIVPDPWPDAAALRRLADHARATGNRDAARLAAQWPTALPGLHRRVFAAPSDRDAGPAELVPPARLRILIACGDTVTMLARLDVRADLLILATAPDRSIPALEGRIQAIARLARPGAAVLLPRGVAANSAMLGRASLRVAPGTLPPHAQSTPWLLAERASMRETDDAAAALGRDAHIAIIGAGLAGSACAATLADRGWRISLLDAAEAPRAGAGQPLLADHPHLSPDDNPLARLTRHGLAAARRWRDGAPAVGRLQLAPDRAEAQRQARAIMALGPRAAAFARQVDASEASDLAGVRLERGGLWLPRCAAIEPLALCRAWRARPGIECRFGRAVARLHRRDAGWDLLDEDGGLIASAEVVILAAAEAVARLAGLVHLPLQRLRGQSTLVSAAPLAGLRCVVGADGYVCPIGNDVALVGASTDGRALATPDAADDARNLARLRALIPGLHEAGHEPRVLGAAVGWRVATPDRLPVVGPLIDEAAVRADAARLARNDRLPLPSMPGLHALCGLGARGLLWGPLGAELIADRLAGTPPALERDLRAAIDPGRFLRHRLRHGLPV
jgi:tRNA 5-methylaminomethyl-2-thiouridine biosynthesis bifunctional protein